MKKFLPLIILLLGIVVVATAILIIRGRKEGSEASDEETQLLNVPLDERPIVTLTPTSDGHYLKLKIEKIVIKGASLDYELLYQTSAGITQGVPGTVSLEGKNSFETDLLLGSESSGKFRYDEGVEEGSLTLRFRNEKGKLLAKFASEFNLRTQKEELAIPDGRFKFILDKVSGDFFVIMSTIGVPKEVSKEIAQGPFGVFTSSEKRVSGKIESGGGQVYRWDGSEWRNLGKSDSTDIGIFVVSP